MHGISAGVASGTTGGVFAEILQEHPAPAPARLHISPHRRRDVSPTEVLRPPQDDTLRRLPISARSPGLLVIGLEGGGWAPMNHLPHIGLVDAHSERARRDDDVDLIG